VHKEKAMAVKRLRALGLPLQGGAFILLWILSPAPASGQLFLCPSGAFDLRDVLSTCARGSALCEVSDTIVCTTVNCCPSNPADPNCCFYDLTDFTDGLKMTGAAGKFEVQSGEAHLLHVKAKKIDTGPDFSVTRFVGTGKMVTVESTDIPTSDCALPSTVPDFDVSAQITNVASQSEGITMLGHCVKTGAIIATSTASGVPVGDILVRAGGDLTVRRKVHSTGATLGGVVELNAGRHLTVTAGDGILARTNAGTSCSSHRAGTIRIYSRGEGTQRAIIDLRREVEANIVAAGAIGDGGDVVIERDPASTNPEPEIIISAGLDVRSQGGACKGGTITVEGYKATMDTGASARAGGGSGTGTGGVVEIVGLKNNPVGETDLSLTARDVASRGKTGGTVKVPSDGSMLFKDNLNVAADSGPDGKGGMIEVRAITKVAGCTVEPCDKPSCMQHIQVDPDVFAHGYGTSGVGGSIIMQGNRIQMNKDATRSMNANGKQGTPGGALEGSITLAGREFVKAERNDGVDHTVEARKVTNPPPGAIKTTANLVGGIFIPTPQQVLVWPASQCQ
jgi:hypothetical protein